MQFGGPNEPDEEPIPPFQSETHIRVLDLQDRRPIGHEMTGLTRPGLFLIRARVNEVDGIEVGSTIEKESTNIGSLRIIIRIIFISIFSDSKNRLNSIRWL